MPNYHQEVEKVTQFWYSITKRWKVKYQQEGRNTKLVSIDEKTYDSKFDSLFTSGFRINIINFLKTVVVSLIMLILYHVAVTDGRFILSSDADWDQMIVFFFILEWVFIIFVFIYYAAYILSNNERANVYHAIHRNIFVNLFSSISAIVVIILIVVFLSIGYFQIATTISSISTFGSPLLLCVDVKTHQYVVEERLDMINLLDILENHPTEFAIIQTIDLVSKIFHSIQYQLKSETISDIKLGLIYLVRIGDKQYFRKMKIDLLEFNDENFLVNLLYFCTLTPEDDVLRSLDDLQSKPFQSKKITYYLKNNLRLISLILPSYIVTILTEFVKLRN